MPDITVSLTDEQLAKLTESLQSGRPNHMLGMLGMRRRSLPLNAPVDASKLINELVTGIITDGDRMTAIRARTAEMRARVPKTPPVKQVITPVITKP